MQRKRFESPGLCGLSFETLETRALLTVLMTPQEQLFIELVNRARADPLAEVRRNPDVADLNEDVDGEEYQPIDPTPKQPLAPHQSLIDAMIGHVDDMLRQNFFAHDNPNDGGTPSSRARAAGYPTGAGENIAWSGNTRNIDKTEEVYLRHRGLFDSVGHRVNMMRENWREIGPGIRYGTFTNDGTDFTSIMAGTLFGDRGGEHFLTGVAISDQVTANHFYEIGEGLGNVLITAVNTQTTEVYSVRTGNSGGYSLQVPNGIYAMTATGGRLTRPLTVRGVHLDGQNVKVDFNSRSMDTRYVQGRFFSDANSNGRRDSGESTIAGNTAYLDLNNNERLDEGEPNEVADSTGLFRIDGLIPGAYTVRSVIPEGWETSSRSMFALDTSAQSIIGVDFALRTINLVPNASNDFATGFAGQDMAINVLQNDTDPENDLDPSSIRITSLPQNGQASVDGQQIVYRSHANFSGTDNFTYQVSDGAGNRSNVARVSVNVNLGRSWQNPAEPRDVDGNGIVSPRDALALITEINTVGSHSLLDRTKQVGDPFFDVSGDDFLSPIDVLHVVSLLNQQNTSNGEPAGEPPAASAAVDDFFAMNSSDDEDESPLERFEDADLSIVGPFRPV